MLSERCQHGNFRLVSVRNKCMGQKPSSVGGEEGSCGDGAIALRYSSPIKSESEHAVRNLGLFTGTGTSRRLRKGDKEILEVIGVRDPLQATAG